MEEGRHNKVTFYLIPLFLEKYNIEDQIYRLAFRLIQDSQVKELRYMFLKGYILNIWNESTPKRLDDYKAYKLFLSLDPPSYFKAWEGTDISEEEKRKLFEDIELSNINYIEVGKITKEKLAKDKGKAKRFVSSMYILDLMRRI